MTICNPTTKAILLLLKLLTFDQEFPIYLPIKTKKINLKTGHLFTDPMFLNLKCSKVRLFISNAAPCIIIIKIYIMFKGHPAFII